MRRPDLIRRSRGQHRPERIATPDRVTVASVASRLARDVQVAAEHAQWQPPRGWRHHPSTTAIASVRGVSA